MNLDTVALEEMIAEVEEAGGVLKPSKFWDGFAAESRKPELTMPRSLRQTDDAGVH